MFVALTLMLAAIVGGALATYLYDVKSPPGARLFTGAITGCAALALIGFVLASLVGLGPAALLAAGVLVLSPVLLLLDQDFRDRLRLEIKGLSGQAKAAILQPSSANSVALVFYLVVSGALLVIYDRVLFARDGGLWSGYGGNLGDLPFHMQVVHSFAFGGNFPPEDPTYAGTGFAYPYMADFLSAMFLTAGLDIRDAMLLQNVGLAIGLVGVLQRWAADITRDRLVSFVTPVLVLLSGGLGWLLLLGDARLDEGGLVGLITRLPHDYTIGAEPILRWGNAITTLLVTQRSLLMGLPLAIVILTLLWHELTDPSRKAGLTSPDDGLGSARPSLLSLSGLLWDGRRLIGAGLLTGMLPLIHPHSFMVVLGTAGLLGLLFRQWQDGRWRWWVLYLGATAILAAPELAWGIRDSIANTGAFFGIEPGWDHGEADPFWFWFVNTGLFIPLLAIALLWRGREPLVPVTLLLYWLPFVTWFVLPNLVKFAPWVWDNIKVLFYWYVGSAPIVALLLARLWRKRGAWALGALGLGVSLTLAGSLDIWRAVSGRTASEEFEADSIAIAERIKDVAPPRALILHAPTWNPSLFMTGRRSLLGYTGYIWAHGLPYAEREADIRAIYAGGADAEELLRRWKIDFVLVTPIERAYPDLAVDDEFFESFELAGEAGEYRLYKVARP